MMSLRVVPLLLNMLCHSIPCAVKTPFLHLDPLACFPCMELSLLHSMLFAGVNLLPEEGVSTAI